LIFCKTEETFDAKTYRLYRRRRQNQSHDEFDGRFDVDASCDLYEAAYSEEEEDYFQHGTMVASIIGAGGNNNECSVGIAPQVTLSSCVFTTVTERGTVAKNRTWLAHKVDQMDISQNSYGTVPCEPAGAYSMRDRFEDVDECPFADRPMEYIFQDEEMIVDHPCDVCEFPSDNISEKCADTIHYHCLLFFEWDRDTCRDHLDGLSRGRQCTFFSEDKAIVESLERGAEQGRDGKGIIYVFSSGESASTKLLGNSFVPF